MSFADPWFLLLFLVLLPMIWFYFQPQKNPSVKYSSLSLLSKIRPGPYLYLRHGFFILRLLAVSALIITLARPQHGRSETKRNSEGLDIVLAVDTSGSMRALDFIIDDKRQNRLEIIKRVLTEFIQKRFDDRLGMVVFGTEAFVQSPLTLDHDVLLFFLKAAQIGMAGDKTAIGDAIAACTKRLKDLDAKSKIIILLTDGENTAGSIDPLVAVSAAKSLGIKIYTIGVGSKGRVPIPYGGFVQYVEVSLDEELLQKIADETGGKYFLATNTDTLFKVYQTIDQLEKTKVETKIYKNYEEKYAIVLWSALFLLIAEILLGLTRLRRIP